MPGICQSKSYSHPHLLGKITVREDNLSVVFNYLRKFKSSRERLTGRLIRLIVIGLVLILPNL
jgi:hypothetical protein